MQIFFAVTLFTSATLLFVVQPMFAKMVLPLLGGTPSVWNTCMVFYQAVLLAGYVYAHVSTRWLGLRRQAVFHLVVLALPWLVLPIAISDGWTPPVDSNPATWLLALMTVSVGLPFFVVAASAPMLQAWFAGTGHPAAKDPYFLYAASNLGSMFALLGYPVVLEPNLRLAEQTMAWAAGYGLLMALTFGCALFVWRSRALATVDGHLPQLEEQMRSSSDPTFRQRLRWLALSFVPSSLLLGVTNHISTDIAAVPLLWVVPLALYLLTFVLVFARRKLLSHTLMLRVQPYLVVLLAVLYFHVACRYIVVGLPLHLATFFVTAMVCHGELARARPRTRFLTEYYIWMSAGGVLGGLFNALVAPNVFPTLIEYPLMIAVACTLRPGGGFAWRPARSRWLDFALPAMLVMVAGGFVLLFQAIGMVTTLAAASFLLLATGVIGFGFQQRPLRFGLGIGAVLLVGVVCFAGQDHLLHVERNFFGVIRVKYDAALDVHAMVHGSTNHGMQSCDPQRSDQPLAYYHRRGPLGQVFSALCECDAACRIGIIGLGTGSISCYARPGQHLTYYEIDPAVERVARNPRLFTYLDQCRGDVDVVLGDARLTLADAPDGHHDVLILDAFSSDAVPVHLITREALDLYFRKLSGDGALVLHISNRYLNLEPVLGNLAAAAGIAARVCRDGELTDRDRREGKFTSCWVAMAREPGHLGSLLDDSRWRPLASSPGAPIWTDDFSNIVAVVDWW